ncbi:MAG: hypothetical protein OER77_08620 [Myxococcales bacterium]|nr:hypothetical protein [Myxococcales bacterium]
MESWTAPACGAVALCLLLFGCGDPSLSHGSAGGSATTVGLSTCIDLAEGEELSGVGPDGHAWVTSLDGLRVVDPDGESQSLTVRFGSADELVAWTADRAFIVSESQLWDAGPAGSQPFILPDNLGRPRYACGDPEATSGSFVLGTRGLFERRGSTWFRWDIPIDVFEEMKIQHFEGSCATDDEILYLTTTEGALWEVRFGDNPFLREIGSTDNAQELAVDSEHGIIRLFLGSLYRYTGAWEYIPFDGGFVMHTDAAGGVVWATVREKIFRRDRFARWQEIEPDTTFAFIDKVLAYPAGGAWVVEDSRMCHFGHRESVVVNGVRPFERLDQDNPPEQLTIMADPTASMSLSASIDGRSIPVNGVSGLWTLGELGTIGTGWHELTLDLSSPLGPVQRTVPFRVDGEVVIGGNDPTVFYEADIKPIFDMYCAQCHGPTGTQRFFGDYETFVVTAQSALELIKSREMPPPPLPGPSQGEIGLIETWIQEGMAP